MTDDLSIIVCPRDQFSSVKPCLRHLLQHVPEGIPVHVVFGGVPDPIREDWHRTFSGRVDFHLEPGFLSPSAARNIGLRKVDTSLAILIDGDVFGGPGFTRSIYPGGPEMWVSDDGEEWIGVEVTGGPSPWPPSIVTTMTQHEGDLLALGSRGGQPTIWRLTER